MKSCTILILTYKGKHHLEHLLPTVVETIENSANYKIDVLIVDNGCDETTKNFVKTNFPDFRYEFSPVNDYLFSLNPYIQKLETEFFLLLNDDMRVEKNLINESMPLLENDKNIFSVVSNILNWDGTEVTVFVREMFYKRGWLFSKWNKENNDNKLRYTLYGGAGIFRTLLFNQLNGFDSLFRPAYCEDLDLGHRAWQKGWSLVYNPKAILFHRVGGTITDQFKADKLEQGIYKNQILWMVKNGTYKGFFITFWLMLPYRILFGWKVSKNSYKALLLALKLIPEALRKRKKIGEKVFSDEKIMTFLNKEYGTTK